jgi:hypothetical protein
MKSNKNTTCSVRLEIYATGRYALREFLETPCCTYLYAYASFRSDIIQNAHKNFLYLRYYFTPVPTFDLQYPFY